MIVMAFNQSALYQLPFVFDFKWFAALSDNQRLLDAGFNTIKIALINTVIATALGSMAALVFARYSFRGKTLLQLLLFRRSRSPGSSSATPCCSCSIGSASAAASSHAAGPCRPVAAYVIIVVGAQFSPSARLSRRRRRHSAPRRCRPSGASPADDGAGHGAAALFAFAVSFDQFVISYFLAAPGVTTLPVEIYTAIRKGYTPEINAIPPSSS